MTSPRFLFLLAALPAAALAAAPVRVWEEKAVIPTYLAADPEPNPMFFFGRSSQGAQGPVYPYPMFDRLTGRKVDHSYTLVYLENEYVRIGVLPEIGGRIFEGYDKTNGYHFFYRQHVIKPALIGLIGAWISGGVEWNIPHHHRASTFMPVQYRIEEGADGARTVWVGELEIRHRMRWAVGYTLRPGSSVLEAQVRIVNRTPVANTMLCFANVAVHTNDQYQVIFPPSTQLGTGHAKLSFTKWPIDDDPPTSSLGRKNVDFSWWKNHISAASVFAWQVQEDFFAGYDHGRQVGTMSVADHRIVPGQKFFTWGNSPAGERWSNILTDADGPYLELMVGAYSDNQPDYSWLQPHETRSFSMHWYPFSVIGGVKRANLDAAVNLDVAGGAVKFGFASTAAHRDAQVTLRAGSRVLVRESIAIDPGKPYLRQIPLPADVDPASLTASLSAGGKEVVSYTAVKPAPAATPPGVKPPVPPKDVATLEELYLIGLRAQQFHSPSVDPLPYWQEALRRDPSDIRVNTALGITAYKKARYAEAEPYLRRAVARLTALYTRPKDGEALYYLGLTLRGLDREAEAGAVLADATWAYAWRGAAYYELAELATRRGDFAGALDAVRRSLDANGSGLRARNLEAAILRRLGRSAEASRALESGVDPLDARALAERWLLTKDAASAERLADTFVRHLETAQETGAEYFNAGLWQEGFDVLRLAADARKSHPLVHYYLGYFATKLGKPAAEHYQRAAELAPDYVFPFQAEAIPVLRAAILANPRDARAPYYLGNLLYDWQPEEAIRQWESAAALDPSFAIAHRNLGVAYAHRAGDLDRAIAAYEKAIACPRAYPLHFAELDALWEQSGAAIEKRLRAFEDHAKVVAERDDSQNRLIALKTAAGQYDDAIRLMQDRPFAIIEGANLNVAEHWTNAHLRRGQQRLKANQYRDALADFQAALAIPVNLPNMRALGFDPGPDRRAPEVAYWSGLAYEGLGDARKAAELWREGASVGAPNPGRRAQPDAAGTGERAFYQALCQRRAGETARAVATFESLVAAGNQAIAEAGSQRAKLAQAHYLLGLGRAGLGAQQQAREAFAEALRLSPDLPGARTALAALD